MGDNQQVLDGQTAGGNTPVQTPNNSGSQDTIDWKAKAEEYEGRYKGASTKINEYDKDLKQWQQKFAALQAETEGLRASSTNAVKEWETKAQTLQQQYDEQSKKLAMYDLSDKVRSIIHTDDFKELASAFESDPLYRAGVLTTAQQTDDEGFKKALTNSLALRKGLTQQAIDTTLQGSTTPPPSMGAPAGMSTEQLLQKLLATPPGTKEYAELEAQLDAAAKKK